MRSGIRKSWSIVSIFKRLKIAIVNLISGKSPVDIEELENLLIEADFGVSLSSELASKLKKNTDVKSILTSEFNKIFNGYIKDIDTFGHKPFVITLCGVNGSGKTTTVAKLIYKFKSQGLSVDVSACDTFRVAADTQLEKWTEKLGCKLFKGTNKDPASVAYVALNETESDVLIIDTAGRLPTNKNLMDELQKIYRVVKKIDASAPHLNLLVLDATTGQNAIEQVKSFGNVSPMDGFILTKADVGAKGGFIVRIVNELHIPVFGIGTGEQPEDFKMFNINEFVENLIEE